jgi:hypothetical protein
MEKGNNPRLDTVLKVLAPLGKHSVLFHYRKTKNNGANFQIINPGVLLDKPQVSKIILCVIVRKILDRVFRFGLPQGEDFMYFAL